LNLAYVALRGCKLGGLGGLGELGGSLCMRLEKHWENNDSGPGMSFLLKVESL
jgi:hypothetical protein